MKHTFYIEVDTLWKNSQTYWIGPFDSKDEANEYMSKALEDGSHYLTKPGNIRNTLCYYGPYSKTVAKKRGMREKFMLGVVETIMKSTDDLYEEVNRGNW